jgi:hypothetical protein
VRQDPHPNTAPRHGWRAVQVLVIAGAVVAYFGIRGLTEGATDLAVHNAERLVALERLLGLAWEADLQRAVIDAPLVTTLANWIYIYGHWPFIIVVLSWLVIRHRSVFERVRDAMLASGGVGLVIFATLPMAPPRLAGIGLVDTVTARSNSTLASNAAGHRAGWGQGSRVDAQGRQQAAVLGDVDAVGQRAVEPVGAGRKSPRPQYCHNLGLAGGRDSHDHPPRWTGGYLGRAGAPAPHPPGNRPDRSARPEPSWATGTG